MRTVRDNQRLMVSAPFIFISLMLAAAGCSALTIPNPQDIAKTPLGTESIKIGMTKAQVESIWGRPDSVTMTEDNEKWKSPREVWIYRARYGSIPVDAGYLSQDKKLYFDGPNLTEIGE